MTAEILVGLTPAGVPKPPCGELVDTTCYKVREEKLHVRANNFLDERIRRIQERQLKQVVAANKWNRSEIWELPSPMANS